MLISQEILQNQLQSNKREVLNDSGAVLQTAPFLFIYPINSGNKIQALSLALRVETAIF